MLRVLSVILNAVDRGDVAALILLDMSAAFDTVDHSICCSVYSRLSASTTPFTSGFDRTCLAGDSVCAVVISSRRLRLWYVACRMGQC